MDVQIIGLLIGLVITFVLGLVNFLWGPAILARREKVAVVNSTVNTFFLPQGVESTGYYMKPGVIENHTLQIVVECTLVLTGGEKETEVMDVQIRLHKETYEEVKKYFRIPSLNKFFLHTYASDPKDREFGAVLEPKKRVYFAVGRLFECTDEFEKEYEKIEGGSYPEFVQPLLDELKTRYHICWTRYDGKETCWKFPDKWWRNLGKKLWG